MKPLFILSPVFIMALLFTSCKKKENVSPVVKTTTDSMQTAAAVTQAATPIVYPYTQSYTGTLYVAVIDPGVPSYADTVSPYVVYVKHLASDTFIVYSCMLFLQHGLLASLNDTETVNSIDLYFGDAGGVNEYYGPFTFQFSYNAISVTWDINNMPVNDDDFCESIGQFYGTIRR